MDKTRTPLAKWAAAIDLLSSTNGVNAAQLAAGIGVSHKTAWLMLRKFRNVIAEVESSRKLTGVVQAGLLALAPKYIFTFLPHRHYRRERVVALSASIGSSGLPSELRIGYIEGRHLIPGWKEPTPEGKAYIVSEHAHPQAELAWLNDTRMHRAPLRQIFRDAQQWLNRVFNGIGTKYLQSYLDEYCYRWNPAAGGLSLREEWYKLCFGTAS